MERKCNPRWACCTSGKNRRGKQKIPEVGSQCVCVGVCSNPFYTWKKSKSQSLLQYFELLCLRLSRYGSRPWQAYMVTTTSGDGFPPDQLAGEQWILLHAACFGKDFTPFFCNPFLKFKLTLTRKKVTPYVFKPRQSCTYLYLACSSSWFVSFLCS